MSTNKDEQNLKEIESKGKNIEIGKFNSIDFFQKGSENIIVEEKDGKFKRQFQLQKENEQNEENLSGMQPDKKIKLSNTEEMRKKIKNFRPFTRNENVENLKSQISQVSKNKYDQLMSRNQFSKLQVLKNSFIIQICLVNKVIQISAQSRIDQYFILVGQLKKQDIPESLQKSGYTLPSQIFSLIKKNKDQLQIDPLFNLKIVIIQQKGNLKNIRKFRYPLTQKTLTFQEKYLKKMRQLEEQNHRLQCQLSQIAIEYENQLQLERKKLEYERQQKEKLILQLQNFKKIDMQDLIAKQTMDLDGIIEVIDKEKFKPVVSIQEDCQQINVQSLLDPTKGSFGGQVSGPVVDIQKITLQKNYSETIKNQQFLKLLQSVQKVAKNSENIDKNFVTLLIDIIVDEDKKNKSSKIKPKENVQQVQNASKQKPLDLSVYQQKFLSGNVKLPQPPEVEIIPGPNHIYPNRRIFNQNSFLMKKQDQKIKQKKNRKVEKKVVDITIKHDQNKQKIEKQLKEFLFGAKQHPKNISCNLNENKTCQNEQIEIQNNKILCQSAMPKSTKTKTKQSNQNNFNENFQQLIQLEVQSTKQLPNFQPHVQLRDRDIQIIEEKKEISFDRLSDENNKKNDISQLPTQDQPDVMIISESPLPNSSKKLSQKNQSFFFEQDNQQNIQVLNLEEEKQILNIQDEVIFTHKKPQSLKNDKPNKLSSGDRFPKGMKNDVFIQKVVSNKNNQKHKPLILSLNHYYKGQNPKMSLQEQKQLLIAQSLSKMRPRMGKVFQTSQYQQKKKVWTQFALSLDTNDLSQLMSQQNYGDVHKIFKSDKLFGTMAWAELFYNVRVLDLGGNNITYIEGLKNLKRIQKLDLSRNLITKIENLEYQINMRELYLRENKIQIVENIFHMKKLDTLALQSNHIFDIDDKIGDIGSLRYLYLQKNRIRKLKPSLKNLRLMAFKIFGNGINYDQNVNKDIIDYLRSTRCDVHLEDFLL